MKTYQGFEVCNVLRKNHMCPNRKTPSGNKIKKNCTCGNQKRHPGMHTCKWCNVPWSAK